jgi:hypothetical protein
MNRRHLGSVLQLLGVSCLSLLMTILADSKGFVSPFNLVWMVGIPIIVGVLLNGPRRRLPMVAALIGVSLLTQMVAAAFFGLGY